MESSCGDCRRTGRGGGGQEGQLCALLAAARVAPSSRAAAVHVENAETGCAPRQLSLHNNHVATLRVRRTGGSLSGSTGLGETGDCGTPALRGDSGGCAAGKDRETLCEHKT